MGLLDNDNAVITIDAVLTDLGRDRIARNDGTFEIVRYAFGDDEIDYSLFNPNTGSLQQDNNILNTPIFEAFVNEKIALKDELITISNPNLKYLPVLESTTATLSLGEKTESQVGKALEFKQAMKIAGRIVPSEVVDASFSVFVNNDLLFVEKQTPVSIAPFGTAHYVVRRSSLGADQGARVQFNVAVKSLTSEIWNTLGTGTVGSRTITTIVRCKGVTSGMDEDVTITINEQFQR